MVQNEEFKKKKGNEDGTEQLNSPLVLFSVNTNFQNCPNIIQECDPIDSSSFWFLLTIPG